MIQFPSVDTIVSGLASPLIVLTVLMIVDFLLGTITAIVRKEFKLEELSHYLQTDFLPILAWVALRVVLFIPAEYFPSAAKAFDGVVAGVYVTVFLTILASILGTVSKIGVLKDQLAKIGVPKQ